MKSSLQTSGLCTMSSNSSISGTSSAETSSRSQDQTVQFKTVRSGAYDLLGFWITNIYLCTRTNSGENIFNFMTISSTLPVNMMMLTWKQSHLSNIQEVQNDRNES
jgi:hypothetical protein